MTPAAQEIARLVAEAEAELREAMAAANVTGYRVEVRVHQAPTKGTRIRFNVDVEVRLDDEA